MRFAAGSSGAIWGSEAAFEVDLRSLLRKYNSIVDIELKVTRNILTGFFLPYCRRLLVFFREFSSDLSITYSLIQLSPFAFP